MSILRTRMEERCLIIAAYPAGIRATRLNDEKKRQRRRNVGGRGKETALAREKRTS